MYFKKYDYFHAVSTGQIGGVSSEVKFGYNTDIDTGEEDIWPVGGSITYLSSAEIMNIVSNDATDAAAGTGARTLRIFGLDNDYNEITEDVTLNGLTDVETTLSYLRVHRMYILTAGTNETNAGRIRATAKTSATIQAEIPADYGQTQQSIWTVPAGKTAYITAASFSSRKTTGGAEPRVQFIINIREFGGAWRRVYREDMDVSALTSINSKKHFHSAIPEKTDIRLSAITDTNNTVATGRLYIILYDN